MDLWLYFLTLILVLNFHRFVGSCVNKIGIPRIIGDIIAGCLLGPTIMGPSANLAMFPYDNRQLVNMSGQFGLIMTSMNAGFNFDRRVLSGRKMIFKVVMYTFLNMAIPTLIAVPLAYILPNTSRWRGPDESFHFGSYFTLIACAMSSSALPMVFLILDELKLKHRFAIGFSCLSTIALFTMLSVASALADPAIPTYMIAIRLMLLFVAVVALIVMQLCWSHLTMLKPLLAISIHVFIRSCDEILVSDNTTLFVIGVALGSAVISDRLGYTFLLGAFLAGAAMPFDMSLRSGLAEKVRWMTRWLFLPQYFLYSGFSFNLREIEASDLPFIVLFVVLAFASKAVLVPATHYILGFSWREAAFCASLANCRGFNALIIGDTGRTLGQIGEALYVTCTLLSVLSTSAAGPLAKFFKSETGEEDHGRTPARTPRRTPRNLSPRREHDPEQSPDSTIEAEKIELGTDGASDEVDMEDDVPMPAHGAAREEMFESFLSERTNAESGMVLVCFPEDVSSRMRDARNGIKCEPQKPGEEPKFTGTAATEWLCRFYRIERRALGVELAQRLLEAGVLSPITTPIFTDDKKHFYTFGM